MNEQEAGQNLAALLFASLVFVASVGVFLPMCLRNGEEIRSMSRWPTVEGTVERSRLHAYSGKGGRGFLPEFEYRYSVAGNSYVGIRTSAAGMFASGVPHWREEATAMKSLPSRGSPIHVRYNPERPADSVIYVMDPAGADYLASAVLVAVGAASGCVAFIAGRRLYRGVPKNA